MFRPTSSDEKKPATDEAKVKKLKELVEGYRASDKLKYQVYCLFGVNAGTVRVKGNELIKKLPKWLGKFKAACEKKAEVDSIKQKLIEQIVEIYNARQNEISKIIKKLKALPNGTPAEKAEKKLVELELDEAQKQGSMLFIVQELFQKPTAEVDHEKLLSILQHVWGFSEHNENIKKVRIAKKKFEIMSDLKSTLEVDSGTFNDTDKLRACRDVFQDVQKAGDLATHRDSVWDNCMIWIGLCLIGIGFAILPLYGLFNTINSYRKYNTARIDKPESERLSEAGLAIIGSEAEATPRIVAK